jgi:hypothetical protein
MIKLKSLLLLTEAQVRKISLQNAIDNNYFGPIYHGTSSTNREKIDKEGFKLFYSDSPATGDVSNGYGLNDYNGGIPAPLHHFGFGIYFTTVKSIAKKYNFDTTRGLKTYFVEIPKSKIETINFAAPHKMMKWWIQNGYNYDTASPEKLFGNPETDLRAIKNERVRATVNLTNTLKSKYEAVWFKGKGLYKSLLDGDQVCVFDPDKILEIDNRLFGPLDIGSKVRSKNDIYGYDQKTVKVPAGTAGLIINKQKASELWKWAAGSEFVYTIKFSSGGTQHNILDRDIEPISPKNI